MAEQLFKLKNLREIPIDFDFSNDMSIPCRIKDGMEKPSHSRIGQYFGNMYVKKTKWAIVLMSGCFKPEFIEAKDIEILILKWENIS